MSTDSLGCSSIQIRKAEDSTVNPDTAKKIRTLEVIHLFGRYFESGKPLSHMGDGRTVAIYGSGSGRRTQRIDERKSSLQPSTTSGQLSRGLPQRRSFGTDGL